MRNGLCEGHNNVTSPTITRDQTYLHDCDSTTDYSGSGDSADPLGAKAFTSDGDVFTITGTADHAVDDEWYYRSHDLAGAGLDFLTNTYPNFLIKWKTSDPSNALGLRVAVEYTGPTYDNLVGTATVPVYSTTWQVTSGTLTASETVDKVFIYADDYPNTVNTGPHSVYVDFIMFHAGTFTLPQVDNLDFKMEPRNAYIDIWGRQGDITQKGGMKSPVILMDGPMDTRAGWKGPSNVIGEYLYTIWKEANLDPWQYFTSDLINCKVTLGPLRLSQRKSSKSERTWSAELRKYDHTSGTNDIWGTLQWFDLV